eukprot:CAMPEP_0185019092 /NCGR_PEP_ID=MMETSP1103-20130426/1702_1 /TAXON_ID=36769 /ORGANISM="Paraphysomonas bandaiensis, Strain Caron Lab Isolate" /LENGTH=280 /DNA_ID=CAMNT_0027549195 /DNA_START=75 /DNA_END=917 /DNA_ORIENTATION=-
MSGVDSLFKKKKGKKPVNAAALSNKVHTTKEKVKKTEVDKDNQDDEWEVQEKRKIIVTSGRMVDEYHAPEIVEEEDIGTKIETDDTRKILQEVFHRQSELAVQSTTEEKPKEPEPEPAPPSASLSLEDRFNRSLKFGKPKHLQKPAKTLEDEYPTLGEVISREQDVKKTGTNAVPKSKSTKKTSAEVDGGSSTTVTESTSAQPLEAVAATSVPAPEEQKSEPISQPEATAEATRPVDPVPASEETIVKADEAAGSQSTKSVQEVKEPVTKKKKKKAFIEI